MKRIVARCLLLVSGFMISLTTSDQQLETAFAVEVQPSRLELTISTDQPAQAKLQVINPSQKAVHVRIQTGPYRFLDPGIPMPSAEGWFSFEPESFILAPSATSEVTLHVAPPDNVARDTAGEYVAAILIDEMPADNDERPAGEPRAKITIIPRFALPVYLMIQGRELIRVELAEASVRSTAFSLDKGGQPLLRAEAILRNSGSVHVRPTGTLTILHKEGGLYQAHTLGKSLPLLPGGRLTIPAVLPLPPVGFYKAIITIEPNPGQMLQKEIPFEVTSQGEIR